MTENQKAQRQAVNALNAALKRHRGESYVEPPADVIRSDSYRKLSRQQLDQAVFALTLSANLSGGSMGDVDLYKLVRAYLWSEKAREAINEAVAKHVV